MNKIDTLEPDFAEQCREIIRALNASTNLVWVAVQGRRTIAYQNSLYNQPTDGKDNDSDGKIDEADEKVTCAKGGYSPHNYGLACDFAPLHDGGIWWNAPDKYWQALGNIAEGMGLTWGGNFKSIVDRPHVEHPRWREQQALWKAGKLEVA